MKTSPRQTQHLVCTDEWSFGGMSGGGRYELHIFRVTADGKIINHPKWGNKVWKYKTYEQLEAIQATCDRIGLACGALKVYEPPTK